MDDYILAKKLLNKKIFTMSLEINLQHYNVLGKWAPNFEDLRIMGVALRKMRRRNVINIEFY